MRQYSVSQYLEMNLPAGTEEEVCVCHITDPEHFYCHLTKNTAVLDSMMDEIDKCYSSLDPSDEQLSQITLGTSCIAKFTVDGGWYRAEVTGVLACGSYEVKFVDYGNSESVTPDNVKAIQDKFLQQPVMGLKCSLSGVSTQQGYWTPEHIAQFEDVALDQTFTAFVNSCNSDGVFMLELTSSNGKNLNKEFGLKTNTICVDDSGNMTSHRKIMMGQGDAGLHVMVSRDRKHDGNINNGTEIDGVLKEKTELPKGQTEVKVASVYTPSEFWCHSLQGSKKLTTFTEKMNIDYERLSPEELVIDHPTVGMHCVAKFPDDQSWYRGEIVAVRDGESDIYFIDYGNTAAVPKDSLKQMLPQLRTEPPFGIKCCLCNVKPDSSSWNDVTSDEFEGLILDKSVVATVLGKSKEGVMQIKLRDSLEGFDIGEKLAQNKLAVLVATGCKGFPKPEIKVPSSSEVYLSSIESPETFWVQLCDKQAQLDEFVEKIEGFYSSKGTPVKSVHQGMPVVAQFSEDAAWYRAVVTNSSGGKHEVFFVDFGNTDCVATSFLKEVTEEVLHEPVYAVQCSLKDVSPLKQNSNWHPDAKSLLEDVTKDGAVCNFISIGSSSYIVELNANGKDVASFLTSSAVVRRSPSVETCSLMKKGFPNAASIPVKHLEKGYISHTDSPDSFWVQLFKFTAQLDELMESLEAHYSSGQGVPLTNPSVGTPCVAKYSADNAWYRAAVKEVHSTGISVHFVDYGNSEIIDPSVVCKIEKPFLDISTQAINCKLAVNLSRGTNTEAVHEKFLELVLEKELVIKVLNVEGSILMVDILDAGQSVISLLKKEFSSLNTSREPTPSSSSERLDFPPPEVPVGKTKQVYVSYIEDPGLFYVHADVDDLLNEIMDKISKQYATSSEPPLKNPVAGQPCCALYAEDGAWYRGKVVSTTGDMVTVQFVDYGNADKISKDGVKAISSTHLAIPRLAIQCSLDGIEPAGGAWTDDGIAFMEELTVDKVLRCNFKTSKTVKLLAGEVDVGDKLKERGFAKKDATVPSALTAGEPCVLKKQKIPSGSVAAYVSHVDTNGTFYLQMSLDDDAIVNLSAELLDHYSNSGSTSNLVRNGTICCAQFSDDDAWYRAVVEQISGGCATVRFIDYGNTDMSSLKHLKTLEPQFCKYQPFAYACKFENFTTWPTGAQELFKIDTENKELDVKFLSTVEPYTVKISHGGTDLRSKYSGDNVNTEKSFEMKSPPRSSFGSKPNFEEQTKPQPATSFGQKPSFGKPPAQSSSDAPKPGFGKPSEPCDETMQKPSFGGRSQKPSFGSPALKSPTSPPKKEIEVIPIEEQKFKVSIAPRGQASVYISHVEGDIVYIQQSKNIQSVMDTSEKIRKLPDGSSHTAVGYACGAMFTEDKTWYRAEVIEVSDDKITVRFVDFGNKDTLSINSMKPLNRELLWQEPKAFPCKIVGIDTLTPELVNILADLTADKEIVAEFCSQEAPFSVKLNDLEGNDIASLLCPTSFPVQVAPTNMVHGEVVNVLSSGVFYVRLTKDRELIDQVKSELEADYASVKQEELPKIDVGVAYCAKSPKDAWQRAVVKNTTEDEVDVQLVDLGAFCTLNKSNIFPLQRRFLTFPGLTYECILSNFRGWTDEQKEKFVEMTKNKTMNVQFLSKTLPFKVELTVSIGLELLGEPTEAESSQDRACQEPSTESSTLKFPPQTLPDGVTAYASFVDADGSVYIQLSNEEEKLNSITEQLQTDYASGGKALVPMAVGSICCAKFTEDDAWYRATITSVNGDQVTVRFIDYGNTDVMPQTRIIHLSNQHLQVPAMAYHCKLHSYGSWTEESVATFDKVVKDQPLTVKVISTSDVFIVELHLDDGSSVTGHLPIPMTEKPKESPYKLIDLDLGKKTNVHISHVESIFTFYVQPVESEDDLASLAASIGEHYSAIVPDVNVEWMKLGTACVAKYTEDEQWYRGIITSVDEKNCGVHFVDYGNADIISKGSICRLKEDYRTLPAQAVRCKLIVDVAEDKLDEASDALLEMTTEKVVSVLGKCKIVEDEHDVVVVDVLDGDKSVSAALIVTGLCSAVIVKDAADDEIAPVVELSPPSTDEALKLEEQVCFASEAQTTSMPPSATEQPDVAICPLINLTEGQRLSVFISCVQSPSRFYIQLDKQKRSLNKLINTMFEYFNNLSEADMVLESPAVGKLCAICGEDDSWYRGQITKVGDKCTVCYIDHGNMDDVDVLAIKTLPEQFHSLPQQAVQCSLAGIKSSEEAWSDDALSFFQEMISYKSMLMDVLGLGSDGTYIVNLIHMGLPITQKLMEKGYGMEFSTPIINTRVKRVFSDSSETQTPVKLLLGEQDESLSDVEDKFEDCAEEVDSHLKFRYVQNELKEGDVYNVLVTHVTDPSTFFCRLTSSSQALLDLQDDIQTNHAENLTKLNIDDVKPKMGVIVQTKDKQFHRAEVVSVSNDNVSVLLVDYGRQETVTDLWKMSPKFAASIVNVFPCSLAYFKPVDNSWTESASRMFQELTSDKELVAMVIVKKANTVAVELMDDNDMRIGQKLIDEEHALADVSSEPTNRCGDESSSRMFGLAVDDSASLGIESINEDTFFGQPLLESTTVVDVADDQYRLLKLHLEKEYDIDVLEDGSPDNFAVHLLEQSSQLAKIQEALSSINEMDDLEMSADVDKPCLVKIGNVWHRGKVAEKNDSSSEVLLVDYSKMEVVENVNIRKLPSSLLETPIQALCCTLSHISSVENIRWSEDAVQFFQDFVGNRKLGAVVTNVTNDHIYCLRISDVEDIGGFSINRQLVDLGFAEALPGSLIEIEIQLEQTQNNSDLLDELEQSFHEVSYHRRNSFGSDEEDAVGDTSLTFLPELVTPLPSTPLPDVLEDLKTEQDNDGAATMDTANDTQKILPEDKQDANTEGNADNDGNVVDEKSAENVQDGTELESERDAGDSGSGSESRETDHDKSDTSLPVDDQGDTDAVENRSDNVSDAIRGHDTQENHKTEEHDQMLKEDGKEIFEAKDNDVESCRELIERSEDSDGMPSKQKQEDVEESSDTGSYTNTTAGNEADIMKSDSDVACTQIVSELVETVSNTLLDTGCSLDEKLNSEFKDNVLKSAVESNLDECLEVKDEPSPTEEHHCSSPVSDELGELEGDLSSSDQKSSKDGDVDS